MRNQEIPIDLTALVQEARARRDRVVADLIAAAVKRVVVITRNALSRNRPQVSMHTGNAR